MNLCSCQQMFTEVEHTVDHCMSFSPHIPKVHRKCNLQSFTGVSVGFITIPADNNICHAKGGPRWWILFIDIQCHGELMCLLVQSAHFVKNLAFCEEKLASYICQWNGRECRKNIFFICDFKIELKRSESIIHFSGGVLMYTRAQTILTFITLSCLHLWIHLLCLLLLSKATTIVTVSGTYSFYGTSNVDIKTALKSFFYFWQSTILLTVKGYI